MVIYSLKAQDLRSHHTLISLKMERRLEADRTAPLLDKQANSTFINNARPKYEQGAIMFEGESVASVSHAHTTISSEHEASNNDSLDSYVSTRDIRQFIRELHGR